MASRKNPCEYDCGQGIYLLVIRVKKNLKLKVGSLGEVCLGRGIYVYIGSAQKNLKQRIGRHLLKSKRIFWHIDYLTTDRNAKVESVFYSKRDKFWECRIAKLLSRTEIPVPGFGCSDCNCRSHLFKLHSVNIISSLDMKRYQYD